MGRKFAYSYDREDFLGAYDTPEQAFAEAVDRMEGLSSPPTTIYIGMIVEPDPQAADHAQNIIEAMNRRAHVDFGESASRYLKKVTPAQVKELDEALAATIFDWLRKNSLMPTFVSVRAVREYPAAFPGEGAIARAETDEVHDIGSVEQTTDGY